MDPRLIGAAQAGNIDGLYALIKEDASVLEPIEKVPFIDTPLHIAASEGHINFAMELMNLKPSFARKLNQDGWSPVHLAVKNERTELVIRLLETDKNLARVKGRNGKTPLHLVSRTGDLNLLFELLEACPECFQDVTVNNDTAVHLALEHDQIEAFNLLLGWLYRSRHKDSNSWGRKAINGKNNEGNTLLHIAAKKGSKKELEYLELSYFLDDVNARNSAGLTASEIMDAANNVQNKEMNSSRGSEAKYKKYSNRDLYLWEAVSALYGRLKNSLSIDMLNAVLVITALVITATYQSSLSPPGGVFQADGNSITSTTHVLHSGNHVWEKIYGVKPKSPGTPVMDSVHFTGFWFVNSITLWVTMGVTLWLLFPSFSFLIAPVLLLGACYHYSMVILSPSTTWAIINICVIMLIGILPTVFILFNFPVPMRSRQRFHFPFLMSAWARLRTKSTSLKDSGEAAA